MNLEGYEVTHKAFGDGVVVRSNEKYISVRFSGYEKTFVYPDAFNGYMTLSDQTAREAVMADVAASVAAKAEWEAFRAKEREVQMRGRVEAGPGIRATEELVPAYSLNDDEE